MGRDLTYIKGYIYKVTSPNGKVYIGQSINLYSRKIQYKALNFKKQTKLWNNCQKYNWNPIDCLEVIDECYCGPDKCILNLREIYWIHEYDSFKNGLNCSEGGKGNLGRIWTDKMREKSSMALKGRPSPLKGRKL